MTTGGVRKAFGAQFLRAFLIVALAATSFAGVQLSVGTPPAAVAADLSQFQPGNIIADELFFNPNTMNVSEIQAFLNSKVPSCTAGYTCLKDFTQTTFNIDATPMCTAYTGAPNETAATIIYRVAQSCGISPKVILVILQKEQSLVTSTAPTTGRYNSAMGAGCPDTSGCDVNYYGFFQQVQYGSYLLKRYTQPAGTGPGTPYTTRFDLWKPVGQVSDIQYNPDTTCGTKQVLIQNQATHSLYIYTPYTPDQAALDAGYGVGDYCSTYGNRNFFSFYTDWFGSTQVPPLVNLAQGPSVLGTPTVGQFLNASAGQISPSPDSISCIWLRGGSAIAGATGCIYQATSADVGQQLAVTVTSTKTGYQSLTQTSALTAVITVPDPNANGLTAILPARLAETRNVPAYLTVDGQVQGVGAVGRGQTLRVPILGRAGIPTTNVGAVVLNVTATSPTSDGFLTVYPTGTAPPATSNLNFTAGQTVPNSVIAQVGADGSISIYNSSNSTNIIVDVSGWFPATGSFTTTTQLPARLAETRNVPAYLTVDGQVQGVGAVGRGQTLRVPILGRAGIPTTNVGAVVLNVTATSPTSDGFLTVYPTGTAPPATSNLNFTAGQTVPNSVIAQVGADGSISIYNSSNSTNIIVDIFGWFPE